MEGFATPGFREPIRLSVVYINRGRTVSMEASPKVGKDVIEACKAGDRKAFEKIVLFYQKRVFNYAYRMLGNMEEAKELAQEVFVSVFLSIRELREAAKFDAWLKQILLNHCRNRWKFLKRRHYFSMDSIDDPVETEEGEMIKPIYDPSDTPDILYEKKVTQEWIQKGLLKMKEDQRELIVLRDLQGLSYEEMGSLLNLPEGTIKSKLHRARMDLKEILGRNAQ
jgi:RNA polymerase sigma-70 factor (ECF subfamily)